MQYMPITVSSFVQLESCDKADRRLWFMELGNGGVLTQHEIELDKFKICQTLLRDLQNVEISS